MDHYVKINYIVDLPLNETLKGNFERYLKDTGKSREGYKNYLMEQFLKDSVRDLLEEISEDYRNFDGAFVLNMRNERIKGIFKSSMLVKASVDEPLRRKFFQRFTELTGGEDLRVEINLNCMM